MRPAMSEKVSDSRLYKHDRFISTPDIASSRTRTWRCPPGAFYVASFVPTYVLSSLVTYLCLHLVLNTLQIEAPVWGLVLPSVIARPLSFIIWRSLRPWTQAHKAAAQGARFPPQHPQPASTVISRLSKMSKSGYPGDALHEFTLEVGNTLLLSLLGLNFKVCLADSVAALLIQPHSACSWLLLNQNM